MSRYDTFWPRFFALIIDGFALSILTGVLALIPATESRPLSMIINLIHTSLVYVYSIVMIGRYGQTLGKMAMSIKVVDNDTEEKVTYNQAFKREAVPIFLVILSTISTYIIFSDVDLRTYELSIVESIIVFLPSFMSLIWSLLEIITMLFDPKSRALHDKIADTVVVRI